VIKKSDTIAFVRSFVDELIRGGGGVIDSHMVAAAEHDRRICAGQCADHQQTRDYVQYCLREMANVCRHTVGNGRYVVHVEDVCSDHCKNKYSYWNKWLGNEPKRCPTCNLKLPTNGSCGLCD